MPYIQPEVRIRVEGADAVIERFKAFPKEIAAAEKAAARRSTAATYRDGLKTLSDTVDLPPQLLRSHRRVFTRVTGGGDLRFWGGFNPLPVPRALRRDEELKGDQRRRKYREFSQDAEAGVGDAMEQRMAGLYLQLLEAELEKRVIG